MVDATNGGNEMLAMLIDKISKIEQLRVKKHNFLLSLKLNIFKEPNDVLNFNSIWDENNML